MLLWFLLLVFISIFNQFECKPSLSFKLPAIGPFRSFLTRPAHYKNFSGKRVKNDSIQMVYFYDQTVAVVELEPDKLLLNCELIEVYEPEDAVKALGDFTEISPPVAISFNEMLTLMEQCAQLELLKGHDEKQKNITSGRGAVVPNSPFVLFNGIIPGTKWCGTGDVATDYHDLGSELTLDRCCRMHDLCPVKVRAYSHRYNLTNDSIYTKSHCLCDDDLYNCLKHIDSPSARIMGSIYFNFVQVPCLEDTEKGRIFRKPKNSF